MLKRLLHSRIRAFEQRYDYDMQYAHVMLDTDSRSFRRYAQAARLARVHDDVPAAALYAAKLAVTLTEDCGPCTQLVIRMAEEAGVRAETIRAIIQGDEQRMDDNARLAWRFSRAALARSPKADDLRVQIVEAWGQRGLVSLALAMAGSRIFPTIKYAMGYGRSCQRVKVGDEELSPAQSDGVTTAHGTP